MSSMDSGLAMLMSLASLCVLLPLASFRYTAEISCENITCGGGGGGGGGEGGCGGGGGGVSGREGKPSMLSSSSSTDAPGSNDVARSHSLKKLSYLRCEFV